MSAAVEHFYRLSTSVDTVHEAFLFVMESLDQLGDDPQIGISPIWSYNQGDDAQAVRRFEVWCAGTPARLAAVHHPSAQPPPI